MLTFSDVFHQFSNHRGIKDDFLVFETLSIFDKGDLRKGLFVPLQADQKLDQAISAGAIAAIWPKEREIPFLTPNHFPMFLVDNPILALKQITERYIKKIEQEECEKMTKFVLFSPELLNDHPYTYDLTEKSTGQQLLDVLNKLSSNGRG